MNLNILGLSVAVAQRYSVLVSAKTKPANDSYWIRAEVDTSMFTVSSRSTYFDSHIPDLFYLCSMTSQVKIPTSAPSFPTPLMSPCQYRSTRTRVLVSLSQIWTPHFSTHLFLSTHQSRRYHITSSSILDLRLMRGGWRLWTPPYTFAFSFVCILIDISDRVGHLQAGQRLCWIVWRHLLKYLACQIMVISWWSPRTIYRLSICPS